MIQIDIGRFSISFLDWIPGISHRIGKIYNDNTIKKEEKITDREVFIIPHIRFICDRYRGTFISVGFLFFDIHFGIRPKNNSHYRIVYKWNKNNKGDK